MSLSTKTPLHAGMAPCLASRLTCAAEQLIHQGCPSYEVLKPLTDKLVRANPLRGRMQLGKVYFDKDAPWFGEMYHELLHFPAGKHDDQIDALAWAVRLTLGRAAPRQQVPKIKLKSWKDELPGLVGKRGGTFMAA